VEVWEIAWAAAWMVVMIDEWMVGMMFQRSLA
jgi:hypothetical protein